MKDRVETEENDKRGVSEKQMLKERTSKIILGYCLVVLVYSDLMCVSQGGQEKRKIHTYRRAPIHPRVHVKCRV